jgi:hypothetical protein
MGCDAGRDCIHDHVFPRLRDPRRSATGDSYRALAPCHLDREHSLSVSLGNSGRVIWHCFAGCDQETTRAALIHDRVPGSCLRRAADDATDFEALVDAIIFGKDSHPHKVLRLAAKLRGFGDALPAGAELRALADDCGVSLREAYRLRGFTP